MRHIMSGLHILYYVNFNNNSAHVSYLIFFKKYNYKIKVTLCRMENIEKKRQYFHCLLTGRVLWFKQINYIGFIIDVIVFFY